MPKPGFKTFTVTDAVHDPWADWFEERKFNLSGLGISSLSGLITAVLSCVKNRDGVHLTKIMDLTEDEHGN